MTEWQSDRVTKWPSDRKLRRRLTGWYIYSWRNDIQICFLPEPNGAPTFISIKIFTCRFSDSRVTHCIFKYGDNWYLSKQRYIPQSLKSLGRIVQILCYHYIHRQLVCQKIMQLEKGKKNVFKIVNVILVQSLTIIWLTQFEHNSDIWACILTR